MKHPFKFKNAALLMALAAIYPLAAHSAAGVAQFVIGDVSVRRGAATVPVTKGQPIDSGDSIVTGSSGQTQIRFTDGGLVSLTPNSQFNITRYVDDNDPAKDSFAVGFLRGGMRAITGLIGKRNRDNYKVTTSTATIGIRGSAFSARHNADGSLDVAGEQDGIEVCTNAGCVTLVVGEIVRVTSSDSLPSRTALRSNVPPLVARQELFVPENPPEVTPPELASFLSGTLSGVSALFAFGNSGVDYYLRGGQDPSDGEGTFLAGQMVQHIGNAGLYSGSSQLVAKTSTGAGTFGTVGGAQDPGFIGWGYWDEGSVTTQGMQFDAALGDHGSSFMGVHYVVGRPTPQAQMPTTGAARFALLGGTAPTAFDYESSTLRVGTLLGASLNVDFLSGRVIGSINTSFSVEDGTVAVNVFDIAHINGSAFTSIGCGNGRFNGFFTGDQASRAGLVYGASDGTVGEVRGAAVFLNGGGGASAISASFASTTGNYYDSYPRGGEDVSTGIGYFSGNQLLMHDDGEDYYAISALALEGSVNSSSSLGNVPDQDFAGWGYWTGGTNYGSSLMSGLHYVTGRPTPQAQMPVTGTAKYDLAGGTAPTAHYSGTSLVGQLVSAGLNVDFADGSVNAFVNTLFTKNGQPVPVQIAGVGYIDGSTFHSDDYNSGSFNGFFIGNQASRAGLVYQTNDGAVGAVRGAAVFQKNGVGDAYSSQYGIAGMFASGDGFIFDAGPRGEDSYSGSAFFIGNQLFDHDDGGVSGGYGGYGGSSYLGSSYLYTQSAVTSSGSLGSVGDSDFIGWGYWAKGQSSGSIGSGSRSDVHYLVGRPTPPEQMPVTGTASYSLGGGTAPTATDAGGTIRGTLVGASLSADFGSGLVNATVNTQFTKNNVVVPLTVTDQASISGSRFTSLGCNNGTSVNGFFAGNLAARAGIVYSKTDPTLGLVRGAAGFTQSSSSGLSTAVPLD